MSDTFQKPNKKVAVGLGTSISLGPLIAWVYGEATGNAMPPEVAAAIAGLIGFIFSYFIPENE